jgi:PKHD-type hydroxylase
MVLGDGCVERLDDFRRPVRVRSLETGWRSTGPILFEGVFPQARCEALRSVIATDGASPRSYQGLVDPTVRECVYVRSQWSAMPELRRFLVEQVEPVFGVRASSQIDAPLMVYRYGQGVGFVPHHDESHRSNSNALSPTDSL